MVEPREWLIRKGGYYYRPNCAGYTTSKFEAGRYTKAEADREAAAEPWHMNAIHQDDVEDDPVSSRVRMDGEQIASLKARISKLERALAERAGGVKVKALEWEEEKYEPGWWVAQSENLTLGYEVRVNSRGIVRVRFPGKTWETFDGNPDAAKAAAQADFERRILSALEPAAPLRSPLDSDEPQQEANHQLAPLPFDGEQEGEGVGSTDGEPIRQEIVETSEHVASVSNVERVVSDNRVSHFSAAPEPKTLVHEPMVWTGEGLYGFSPAAPEGDDDTCTCCQGTGWYSTMERYCDCADGLAQRPAAPEERQEAVAVWIERDALTELQKHKDATVSVCSGLLKKPFGDKVALYTRPAEQAVTSFMRNCATDRCDKKASVHFERGGVGSDYCHDCYMRVQALAQEKGR